jgi:uncharacterized protein YlxP (DUF503 family)
MPAFHTHWLVALAAIPNEPDYIKAGSDAYQKKTLAYRDACLAALRGNNLEHDFNSARANWESALKENLDAVTCFSAYMLGACGPDFWTLPSEPKELWLVPRMAEIHFDLGHYNRTHRQFELSIAEVGGKSKDDLQTRVQRSYFLGMATHIAADLVVHQLVNVVAGAYNLLEHKKVLWFGKTWVNEHGGAYDMRLWNTHNKVEHFWDSYVRYHYLGDLDPFWPPALQSQGASGNSATQHGAFPLNFPTIEGLEREAAKYGVLQRCAKFLQKEETRFAVEKPLTFPWLFCDRVLAGQIQPFIYRIVVDKANGSYRANELAGDFREKATDEANAKQMKADSPVPSERQNLAFFSSERNTDDGSTSFNFLNFRVCPNVERTRQFAANVFYDHAALVPFVNTAAAAARTFVGELSSAYADGNVDPLKKLRGFWNLDTGLGLRVSQKKSTTDRESITELEFKHVFRELGTGNPEYVRNEPYLAGRKSGSYSFPGTRAFQTYPHDAFESIESVDEEGDNAYLEEIKVAEHTGGNGDASMVQTSTLKEENRLVLRDIKQRLTLRFRASIADLKTTQASQKDSSCEDLALFFLGDKAGKPGKATSEETRAWLAKESKILDYRDQPKDVDKGLQSFETRLLVNTEEEDLSDAKAEMRQIGKGIWNNIVPYSKHEGDYGRNFAIGTGRKHVLHSIDGGTFDPVNSLACYDNVSPTEHVFFTLHALVRRGRDHWDIFTKKAVPDPDLNEMVQISGLGTVKILLIYERKLDDTLCLSDCFIDGLQVRVET